MARQPKKVRKDNEPFEVYYEVEYLGDGDHNHFGEKYIATHHAKGYNYEKPFTLSKAKEIAKSCDGKIVKVTRSYL
jgi:hypothetical protein